MIIERVENNEIVITFSSNVDMCVIQRLIDYGRYLEARSKSLNQRIGKQQGTYEFLFRTINFGIYDIKD